MYVKQNLHSENVHHLRHHLSDRPYQRWCIDYYIISDHTAVITWNVLNWAIIGPVSKTRDRPKLYLSLPIPSLPHAPYHKRKTRSQIREIYRDTSFLTWETGRAFVSSSISTKTAVCWTTSSGSAKMIPRRAAGRSCYGGWEGRGTWGRMIDYLQRIGATEAVADIEENVLKSTWPSFNFYA